MRVGLAHNVKPEAAPAGSPEDAFEEFDSETTVGHLRDAIASLGHDVVLLRGDASVIDALRVSEIDIVFNIAEGEWGRNREAHLPALFELLRVPYVGSDPLTLCVTLDKPVAKRMARDAGFATPDFRIFRSPSEVPDDLGMPLPVIVKPAWEGSSKGVRLSSRATTIEQVREMIGFVTKGYAQEALVEGFVSGPEVTVGVLGNGDDARVLGMMEIAPKKTPVADFVYSLEVKRDWENQVEYHVPPRLSPHVVSALEAAARGLYRLLGCRDFSRIDFRVDAAGTPSFIECNPLPGLSPGYGDLTIIAERSGLPYRTLVAEILGHGVRRHGLT